MLLSHPFLTKRTFFPVRLSRFISSDMNIAGREKCQNFVKDILQECKYAIISRTVDNLGISSSQAGKYTDKVFHNRTSKLGISSQRSVTVCRYIYFRNDFYLSVGSISYNFPNLLLCIETTYWSKLSTLRVTAWVKRYIRTVYSPRSYFRQTRIFLYFNPPAVIVC